MLSDRGMLLVYVSDNAKNLISLGKQGDDKLEAEISWEPSNSQIQRLLDAYGQSSNLWLEYQPHHRVPSPTRLLPRVDLPIENTLNSIPLYLHDHEVCGTEPASNPHHRVYSHDIHSPEDPIDGAVAASSIESQQCDQNAHKKTKTQTQPRTNLVPMNGKWHVNQDSVQVQHRLRLLIRNKAAPAFLYK